ncbi:MAG: hypothetical protein IPH13_08820 [Planctomycetes bacterium]|nr:hypothetical protein [Planctomycetota bacterium]MCC7169238.1 hypothetical protein [Planctomycetota bacterium]
MSPRPRRTSVIHAETDADTYVGTLDAARTRIDGRWTQRGSSWPLVFTKAP